MCKGKKVKTSRRHTESSVLLNNLNRRMTREANSAKPLTPSLSSSMVAFWPVIEHASGEFEEFGHGRRAEAGRGKRRNLN